jgi:hypothetical protein
MGWLSVLLSGIAASLLFKTGHPVLMILAIIATIGCFWSWGMMHNFATKSAKRRRNYGGGFYDIMPQEAEGVPDWIARINMGFSLIGLLLLITGIVMMLR